MKRKLLLLILSLLLIPCATTILLDSAFFFIQRIWKPIYQTYIEEGHKFYIYSLGESTALGVHYGEKSAPARLVSNQFNDSLQGKPIQIISLAESGQTIEFNYFKYYFETLFRPHRNALVVIYSGINENIENSPDPTFLYWQWIQRSTSLSKMAYMLNVFENSRQKYEYRYQQIVYRAKQLEHKTIISQLVGNVRDFDPDVYKYDTLLSPIFKPLLDSVNCYAEKEQWKTEETFLNKLKNSMPNKHPYLNFRLGQNKLNLSQPDSASLYLLNIPEHNKYLGFASWKNKILERVAQQKDVALAKTFAKFMAVSNQQLVGYNLVDDAHHPNLKGYSIMSQTIAEKVAVLTGEPIKKRCTPEQISERLAVDSCWPSVRLHNLVEWYMYEILKTEFPKDRLNRMKYYMEQYKALNPNDDKQLLWEMFVAIFEQNNINFNKTVSSINSSPRKKELIERMNRAFADEERKQIITDKAKQLKMDNPNVQSTFALFFK